MKDNRLIAGAIAAVAGLVVGLGAVFLGGVVSAETSPSTEVSNFDPDGGFVEGSVDYGSRGGDEQAAN